ncbi:MAG: hypothetical protein ABIR46_00575 [Candidatus Saccharimonadales bacterium]
MKKKSINKQPLTLHGLVISLSLWGTTVRALLFGIVAAAVLVVALSEAAGTSAVNNEFYKFIYVIASFLLLDIGYVAIARTYRMRRIFDVPTLLASELLLALLYIAPKIVVSSDISLRVDPLVYVLFIPLVVLLIRMLLGFLFGHRQR